MSRLFYHVMQDNAGNLLFDVSGTMRIAGSGTLATIYGDEALTVILPNPMTNHPSFASFKCFLGAGDYDFYLAKSGYTFETLTGVQGHGTMAQQDADDVAITGGAIAGVVSLGANGNLGITGTSELTGRVGVGTAPTEPVQLDMRYASTGGNIGLRMLPASAGPAMPVAFLKSDASAYTGTITTTDTTASYNTSSDARLKHAITTLVGELAVIRALRPVRFRWNADDSEGVGFLAQELAEHVQGVVTGEADAVEEDGVTIRPQQIDHSKLVPWLVGAVQTLAGQVETLSERVHILEEALGI